MTSNLNLGLSICWTRRSRTWERLEIMVGFIRFLVIHEVLDKLNLNSLFVACRPLPPSWGILEFTRGRYFNDEVRGICKEYLTANYLCLGCTIGMIGVIVIIVMIGMIGIIGMRQYLCGCAWV